MDSMFLIGSLAVIAGALISLSGFLIARKPSLAQLFAKIAPYQGFLGVGLLAWGLYDLFRTVGKWGDMLFPPERVPFPKLLAIGVIGYVISEIVIGFCLGFGLIAKWIPGESGAEKKGLAIQRKLLGYSLPIGVVGLASGLVVLYYWLTR